EKRPWELSFPVLRRVLGEARPRLLGDEADLAGVARHRLKRLRRRIDPVDAAEEPGLRVAGVLKILVRPHDLARIDRVRDVGRNDDQEFGLVALIVPRTEQGAQNW